MSQLVVAWRRPHVPADFAAKYPRLRLTNGYRATPLMVDGLLYATNAVGLVEAFNPATGQTVWSQQPPGELSGSPGLGGALRAVGYWRSGNEARIFSYYRNHLYALDPKDGRVRARLRPGRPR